eukprot:1583983-Ditylum_brightwellii.AAC.1
MNNQTDVSKLNAQVKGGILESEPYDLVWRNSFTDCWMQNMATFEDPRGIGSNPLPSSYPEFDLVYSLPGMFNVLMQEGLYQFKHWLSVLAHM